MSEKVNKPFYKKWWFWVLVVVVIAIGAGGANKGSQANEQTKSVSDQTVSTPTEEVKSEEKPKLTLDDGWSIDKSNPYMTKVVGAVSNNTDSAINSYVQITFSALDASGANVGDCLANANTVDTKGKWKFEAMCSGNNIETVRFKEITGF